MKENTQHHVDDGKPGPDENDDCTLQVTQMGRRTLLAKGTTAVLVGLAGCSYSGIPGMQTESDCPRPPENLAVPVPEIYERATSEGDIERDPEQLLDRTEAGYQSEPNGDQRCERCSYYIPDKNDDCLGACVRIKGYVDPDGWCEYYRTQVGGGW